MIKSTRRLAFATAVSITFGVALHATAKRAAPPTVNPVVVGDIEYKPVYDRDESQMTAFIEAKNQKTGKSAWKTKLYRVDYNKSKETDVQDIWLKSLEVENKTVLAVDERDRRYELDCRSGKKQ